MPLIVQPHTSEFIAKHPATGDENFGTKKAPVYGKFTVAGVNSPEFYDAVAVLLKASEEQSNVDFGKKSIASCIVNWETSKFYVDDAGEPVEFSHKNAEALVLEKDNYWLVSQLRAFVENQANFF